MANCPYCSEGYPSAEVMGLKMHTFADRWMSCSNHPASTPEDQHPIHFEIFSRLDLRFLLKNLSAWQREVMMGRSGANRIPNQP